MQFPFRICCFLNETPGAEVLIWYQFGCAGCLNRLKRVGLVDCFCWFSSVRHRARRNTPWFNCVLCVKNNSSAQATKIGSQLLLVENCNVLWGSLPRCWHSTYMHRLCDVIVYVQFCDICTRVVWYLDVYVPLCCAHRCDFVCMYRLCDICVFGLFVHICVYMPLVWYLCVRTVCAWCRCIRTVFLIAACTYRLCSCTLTQTEKPISNHAWFPSFSISCVYGLVLFCSHVCT